MTFDPNSLINGFNSVLKMMEQTQKQANMRDLIPTQQTTNPYRMQFGGPLLGAVGALLKKNMLLLGGDPEKVTTPTVAPLMQQNTTSVVVPNIYGKQIAEILRENEQEKLLRSLPKTPKDGAPSVINAMIHASDSESKTNASNKLYEKKYGGKVGYREFGGPSHEQGGTDIDATGNKVMSNASANVEGGENIYNYSALPDKKNSSYVFSAANQTADIVKNIIQKYSKKNTDLDAPTRASMEFEIKKAETLNEKIKEVSGQVNEAIEARYGKKLAYGGDPLKFKQEDINYFKDPNLDYSADSTGSLDVSLFNNTQTNPYVDNKTVNPTRALYDPLKLPTVNSPVSSNRTLNNTDDLPGLQDSNASQEDLIGPYGKAGMFLQGLGLLGSVGQALQPAAKEKLILPDTTQSDASFNRMNANLTNAVNQVLSQNNVAKQQIDDSSLSDAVRSARQMQLNANTQGALANVAAQEQSMRNQIAQTQGSYNYGKAVDVANRTDDLQVRNLQNQSASDFAKDKLFSELTQIGAEVGKAGAIAQEVRANQQIAQMTTREGLAILSQKYSNFTVSEDLISQLEAKGITNMEQLAAELIKYKG